jgi:hypothetical protein
VFTRERAHRAGNYSVFGTEYFCRLLRFTALDALNSIKFMPRITILRTVWLQFVFFSSLSFLGKNFIFYGNPEALASGWLNLFEPEASREAGGELFRHRKI